MFVEVGKSCERCRINLFLPSGCETLRPNTSLRIVQRVSGIEAYSVIFHSFPNGTTLYWNTKRKKEKRKSKKKKKIREGDIKSLFSFFPFLEVLYCKDNYA